MKQRLKIIIIAFALTAPGIADAARYKLVLQSKEALNGTISLGLYNTRSACRRALRSYQEKNPGRTVECKKVKL